MLEKTCSIYQLDNLLIDHAVMIIYLWASLG